MRVAVISDIHANLEALDSVIKDIRKRNVDKIICLGDIIANNTISKDVADVVIYGHIHHPYMDKIYNKTLINVGSVGNSYDVIRNDKKDSNVLETTKANYLIIEGEYGSKEYNSDISFQFIKVPYDIDKELEDEEINIEKDNYRYELKQGKYRDMTKVNNNFKRIGIEANKF